LSLYEDVLARAGQALPPGKPPRDSAAVVPWRRVAGRLEVFWVRRSRSLAFLGGWQAFPGGAVNAGDRAVRVRGEPKGASATQVTPQLDARAVGADLKPGIAAAALRELFEETGVWLGERPADLAAARRRWLDPNGPGEAMSGGASWSADSLVFAGRWLTPPFSALRFDNRFFLLEWPAHEPTQPEVLQGELESGEWIDANRAVELWHRGEVLVAPPVLHILSVLAEDGPVDGLPRLRDTSGFDLGRCWRIEFRPGMLLFPLATLTLPPATHTNAYVVGFEEAALIDPGSGDPAENERLIEALALLQRREGRRVKAIWLTHHHPDHVGGVEAMRRALGVPVLAHRETAARLAERGIEVEREIEDRQELVLAGARPMHWRAVHTPGHARGHLAFFEEASRTLLAGDLISALSTMVIDPPEGSVDEYLDSLDKVRAIAPRLLLPAHGPAILEADAKLAEAHEHRLWREQKILAAWNVGLRGPSELLAAAYEDVPEIVLPLAERQLLAHLQRLERLGCIARA
jgi:glyoxylase-like metal-dependent hydrolase (beta-lactamase superfamily II)/8-oxo-dGTP pyrophosphatase MutT (NUDIX family)